MPTGSAPVASPLDVILVAVGTRGDVSPVARLGKALVARGHGVTLVADAMHAPLAQAAGLAFEPAAAPQFAAAASEDARLWHHRQGFAVVLDGFVFPAMEPVHAYLAQRWAQRRRPLVVAATHWALGARLAHETKGVPLVTLQICPANLRSNRLPPHFRGLRMSPQLPDALKDALWWGLERGFIDPAVLPRLNAYRAQLGLPPERRILFGWLPSPQRVVGLFPPWFAPPQPDWPPQAQLTGFVFADEPAGLPDDVQRFLSAGAPPVVFTFGSALAPARRLFALAAATCQRLGLRGVLLGHQASAAPADLPASVRYFGYVPLRGLLPRAAALVHHGGIGTCALALEAGVRQLAMPLAFDQFDNAQRLTRLGVGAQLDWPSLTQRRLTTALEALLASAAHGAAATRAAGFFADPHQALTRTVELLEAAAVGEA